MEPQSYTFPNHFDLFGFFAGQCSAHGVFEDRFGKLRRQFKVQIQGEVNGDLLRLTEDFIYDDGSEEQRIWTIQRVADGSYRGSAPDVLGNASGCVANNCVFWRYRMNLHIAGRAWSVLFDDKMYLLDNQLMLNRARVSKWGLTLGTVSIFFIKSS